MIQMIVPPPATWQRTSTLLALSRLPSSVTVTSSRPRDTRWVVASEESLALPYPDHSREEHDGAAYQEDRQQGQPQRGELSKTSAKFGRLTGRLGIGGDVGRGRCRFGIQISLHTADHRHVLFGGRVPEGWLDGRLRAWSNHEPAVSSRARESSGVARLRSLADAHSRSRYCTRGGCVQRQFFSECRPASDPICFSSQPSGPRGIAADFREILARCSEI